MKLIDREAFGETEKGYVFVMSFRGTDQAPGDGPVPERFEVRLGAHTIATFDNEREARTMARALVKGGAAVAAE
jgi:hypothetical protein